MSDNQNVDAILNAEMRARTAPEQPEPQTPETPEPETSSPEQANIEQQNSKQQDNDYGVDEKKEPEQSHDDYGLDDDIPEYSEGDNNSNLDDYGNETKERMYTWEEVQEAQKNAVSSAFQKRFKNSKNPPDYSQDVEESVMDEVNENYQHDPNKDGNWQEQLEDFVIKTIDKRQQNAEKQKMQRLEQERNNKFAEKFNTGAERFKDFEKIVTKESVTPTMVMATRGMKDPAAFLYAANKKAPEKLAKIKNMSDPYEQAHAMASLENSLRVNKKKNSNAPTPPSKTPHGTAPVGEQSIDALIRQEALERAKLKGRM